MNPLTEVICASKCQLLIGSFDGSSLACPCDGLNECLLNDEQRRRLYKHPKVQANRAKNRAEYEAKYANTSIDA